MHDLLMAFFGALWGGIIVFLWQEQRIAKLEKRLGRRS